MIEDYDRIRRSMREPSHAIIPTLGLVIDAIGVVPISSPVVSGRTGCRQEGRVHRNWRQVRRQFSGSDNLPSLCICFLNHCYFLLFRIDSPSLTRKGLTDHIRSLIAQFLILGTEQIIKIDLVVGYFSHFLFGFKGIHFE